jgi:hypothetical protein
MNAYMYAYIIILFIGLTPGVLFQVGGSPLIVATVHGLIFMFLWTCTHKYIYHHTYSEGFQIQGFQTPEYNPNPTTEEQKEMLKAEQTVKICTSDDMCDFGKICRSGRCV